MDPKLKKILSVLFIVLSVAAVVCIAFGNPELSNAWDALRSLDTRWIIGLFFCWAGYAFFDALGTWFCLRRQGFFLGIGTVFSITLIGFYYSNITPGASGGQPMQVNSLRKAGVPGSDCLVKGDRAGTGLRHGAYLLFPSVHGKLCPGDRGRTAPLRRGHLGKGL